MLFYCVVFEMIFIWYVLANYVFHFVLITLILRDYRENCDEKMDAFLKKCFYYSGQYSSEEHFLELDNKLKEKEVLCFVHRK